jgi:hypothetical protein
LKNNFFLLLYENIFPSIIPNLACQEKKSSAVGDNYGAITDKRDIILLEIRQAVY